MNKPKAPCKDCTRKGCGPYHSECPKYLAYRDEIAMFRKAKEEAWDRRKQPVKHIFGKKEY